MGASVVTLYGVYLAPRDQVSGTDATPKTNPGTWFTSEDYPGVLIRKDVEGVVRFRLMVNERGVPTACHVLGSTQSEAFEDVVCLALLQ